jgi:hypothetical protein
MKKDFLEQLFEKEPLFFLSVSLFALAALWFATWAIYLILN